MKASVYQIRGPRGSHFYKLDSEHDTLPEARAEARRLNTHMAAGLGLTRRQYSMTGDHEGKYVAMKAGIDGHKTGF